ncbi:MAG TPA: Gfo/Idh/MocA family oxidoreductase [Acidobacteriaceae bacterium]|nr:Gfo/Idh/MocA family oxidoreductase [Acidobacteriaceae bacterium]
MSPSRRSFLKQAGSAVALSAFAGEAFSGAIHGEALNPQAENDSSSTGGKKIGYCIVGLGRISMNQFMPGVKISKGSKIVALVSGHRGKAERIADEYDVPHSAIYNYQNYDSIHDNPTIDAVYIALPNGMHAEYTIRAAKAGKHVLCEKPMANSIKECEQMIAACKQADRKLMIAYRCQYEPTNLKAIELLRQGYAGKLQIMSSANGFNIRAGEWRLNKKMAGGGPLVDVGIYSIQAMRYLTGEEPTFVDASWSVIDHDGRFNEVEENVVWTFRFPSGVLAHCATSYGTNFTGGWARAVGSAGMLELNPAFGYQGLKLTGKAQGKQPIEVAFNNPSPHQFATEADYFSNCILQNQEPKTNGEEGLRDERIITAIYKSCADGKPVKLTS